MNTRSAFDFYQRVLPRLPSTGQSSNIPNSPRHASNLTGIASNFDVFVFDAFGVLNVGNASIEGARACIDSLRDLGKELFVLTNGASLPLDSVRDKFRAFGYDFSEHEIISSRYCAEQALQQRAKQWSTESLCGAICRDDTAPAQLPVNAVVLTDRQEDFDRVDAFVFLSSAQWNERRQEMLRESLASNPKPLIVANPDAVAPLENGFSLEPGYYAHRLLDKQAIDIEFHGKPFPSVYAEVLKRLQRDVPADRIAMLGDTLHTDVIGANVHGWSSVLVSDHGLFRGHDVAGFIAESGIVPDWIIPSI